MRSLKRVVAAASSTILTTLFLFNATILVTADDTSKVVINEIMYNPFGDEPENEWIEFYNYDNHSVNLTGWYISDSSNPLSPGKEGSYRFPKNTLIKKNSCITVAYNGTCFFNNYGFYPDYEIENSTTVVPDMVEVSKGFSLANNGDDLHLFDKNLQEINKVYYGNAENTGLVSEGCSLARYQKCYDSASNHCFYEEHQPSPGKINSLQYPPILSIETYPEYAAKIPRGYDYSYPFAIKVSLLNLQAHTKYELKAYVTSNLSHSSTATQTWDGKKWVYSGYYAINASTDSWGKWSDLIVLRFKKNYKEYKDFIWNSSKAYLIVKYRDNSGKTKGVFKTVKLLDLDDSTKNGTPGGYTAGLLKNVSTQRNMVVILRNKKGNITGLYPPENNLIDEGYPDLPGFYKLTSPAGRDYSLEVWSGKNLVYTVNGVTVKKGLYGFKIGFETKQILVEPGGNTQVAIKAVNTGNIMEKLLFNVTNKDFDVSLKKECVPLYPEEIYENILYLHAKKGFERKKYLNVTVFSQNDLGLRKNIKLEVLPKLPNISITWVKVLNDKNKRVNRCFLGEILTVKAAVKNTGYTTARNVTVFFYCDKKNLIGEKRYTSIGGNRKYPSVKLDTSKLKEGVHNITLKVKYNGKRIVNYKNVEFFVEKNLINEEEKKLVIAEVYYYTHTKIEDEYIKIFNPTNQNVNLTGWYITDQPQKRFDLQEKIVFPNPSMIPSQGFVILTFNATAYKEENGVLPDFEYGVDSREDVRNCLTTGKPRFNNKGDVVALKNRWNKTIDLIVYGENSYHGMGWGGPPVPNVAQGELVKRRFENNTPMDTNTSRDWKQNRRYGVGQSDFPLKSFQVEGVFSAFVSPDSGLPTLLNELRKTRETLLLNVYEISNPLIEKTLEKLLSKGVDVKILVEGNPVGGISVEEKRMLQNLWGKGAKVYVMTQPMNGYRRYGFNHAKYAVMDNKTLVVGSANWDETGFPGNNSKGNREWIIGIKNQTLAYYFTKVFFDDCNPGRSDVVTLNEFCGEETFANASFFTQQHGFQEKTFETFCVETNATVTPVLSPDTSREIITNLIGSAREKIYIEQLYMYLKWGDRINPVIPQLVNASMRGVDVRVILNFNPEYDNTRNIETKNYLEEQGVKVRLISPSELNLVDIHTKGMIVDNKSVLISSINWNEQSINKNREAGVVVINHDLAEYYAKVFLHDWRTHLEKKEKGLQGYKNQVFILTLFLIVSILIIRDWRRQG
ncbi:MAG: lamin tail domain-containing protein [Thermoplasmata archaeon]|nr:lamin tail domain-containing protein [Thermoplasmata archaeon]